MTRMGGDAGTAAPVAVRLERDRPQAGAAPAPFESLTRRLNLRWGQEMLVFHTTLFSIDPPGGAFVSRGAAWSFEKESGVYRGPPKKIHDYSMKLFEERGHAATGDYVSDDVPVFFDMEIMIRAQKAAQAQQAMNLLVSSIAVLDGSITFCPEPFSIEPRQAGTAPPNKSFMTKAGLLDACALANRVSGRRSSSYALHKLALSYQSSSPHMMDLHPGESPRRSPDRSDLSRLSRQCGHAGLFRDRGTGVGGARKSTESLEDAGRHLELRREGGS